MAGGGNSRQGGVGGGNLGEWVIRWGGKGKRVWEKDEVAALARNREE